jgi:hypothetical protein
MDLDVTVRAISVLRVLVVLRTGGFFSADTMGRAMARQAELAHPAGNQ